MHVPSDVALMGPTEPKPPPPFLAAAAGLLLPTWPNPSRPNPMPSRSMSDADFSGRGLTCVGETMLLPIMFLALPPTAATLGFLLPASSSASGS